MADPVLVLRPEPGAARTAEHLRATGFAPIVYPLFAVKAVAWTPPDPAAFDAILMTSANAARLGGPTLALYAGLPVYAVGEATALGATAAGFRDVHVGGGNAAAAVPMLTAAGHASILHLAGAEVRPFDPQGLRIERAILYRTIPVGEAVGLAHILPDGPRFALIHSPRAGELFAALLAPVERARTTLVAISDNALRACGTGWWDSAVAAQPHEAGMQARLQMLV